MLKKTENTTDSLSRRGIEGAGGIIDNWARGVTGEKMLQTAFNLIDNRNYSEAGNLMRDGKMGTAGVLAYTVFNGIAKNQEMAIQSQEKIKLTLAKILEQVVENDQIFTKDLMKIESDRQKLLDKISQRNSDVVKEIAGMLKASIENNKTLSEPVVFRLLDHADKVSDNNTRLAETLCPGDAQFMQKCKEANTKLVKNLTHTINEINKTEQQSLGKMFDTMKEVTFKLIDKALPDKPTNNNSENNNPISSPKVEEVFDDNNNNNQPSSAKLLTSGSGSFKDETNRFAKRIFAKCKKMANEKWGQNSYQDSEHLSTIEQFLRGSNVLSTLGADLKSPEDKENFSIEVAKLIIKDSTKDALQIEDYHFDDAVDNFQNLNNNNNKKTPNLHN